MNTQKFTLWDAVLGVCSFIIGYTSNVLADILSSVPWGKVAAGILFSAGVLGYIVVVRFRPKITLLGSFRQTILRIDQEREKESREGLITVLSWYSKKGFRITDENIASLKEGDDSWIDYENSNFAPFISAVMTHSKNLSHCWILSTTNSSPQKPGSSIFIPSIIRYLRDKKGVNCEFSWKDLIIVIDDDALITEKTRKTVDKIFDQAKKNHLDEKGIIADFTGGTKTMALGIFLACLDGKRDIQFIGTKYNKLGEPEGELYSLITEFSVKTAVTKD